MHFQSYVYFGFQNNVEGKNMYWVWFLIFAHEESSMGLSLQLMELPSTLKKNWFLSIDKCLRNGILNNHAYVGNNGDLAGYGISYCQEMFKKVWVMIFLLGVFLTIISSNFLLAFLLGSKGFSNSTNIWEWNCMKMLQSSMWKKVWACRHVYVCLEKLNWFSDPIPTKENV
jgi:hypothetical protein